MGRETKKVKFIQQHHNRQTDHLRLYNCTHNNCSKVNLIEFYFLTLGTDDFSFFTFYIHIVRLRYIVYLYHWNKRHIMYTVSNRFILRMLKKKKNILFYDLKAQLIQFLFRTISFALIFAASLSTLNE